MIERPSLVGSSWVRSSLVGLWLIRLSLIGLSVVGLQGCGGGEPVSRKLVLTGSSTVAPLAAEIAKRFESDHPGTRVDVQTGGSSRGVADVRGGLADIGMASRRLKSSEEDLLAHPIARDGVCLFLHRDLFAHQDHAITRLTDEQIVAIYTGQVENWSEVGGPDLPITVVNKAEGRATLEVFLGYFGLDSRDIQADVIVGDNEQGIKTVAADPAAIGYVSIGTAEFSARGEVPIRLLPTAGVAATTDNLAAGLFPVARPLNLVTLGAPNGIAREFIDYARSSRVHDLVRNFYFVPVL